METLDGWEEVMMINTLGCSNYGYWAKIAAEYNHTGTVTTELHLDSFWEIDQLAFVCHPSDSRGLGWLAVTFCGHGASNGAGKYGDPPIPSIHTQL